MSARWRLGDRQGGGLCRCINAVALSSYVCRGRDFKLARRPVDDVRSYTYSVLQTGGNPMKKCGDISVSDSTSCPFAKNVREAYFSVPGDSVEVEVHGPVTGKDYGMACVKAGNTVTCRGGNAAVVKLAA